ncbi:MAG: hypothetical protein OEV74_19820 [Cyclobacteriaceae bacterium]|nr:hypothetical protein [Cyclobacteriaceae bacterium]
MKKVITFGLLGGLIMLAVGMLISQLFLMVAPSLKVEYENPNLFRPWSDPIMLLYSVHPFLSGTVLAWIWQKTKALFSSEASLTKGIRFGFTFWIAATIPGMLISYSSFPVSFLMITTWSISVLLQLLCLGLLFARTLK